MPKRDTGVLPKPMSTGRHFVVISLYEPLAIEDFPEGLYMKIESVKENIQYVGTKNTFEKSLLS
jgi:hypothetical protein